MTIRRWGPVGGRVYGGVSRQGSQPGVGSLHARRVERWGRWLKRRRPRVAIEHIDAELLTRYLASCSSFRAKATVYATLSTLRGFGDYLVRQGLWKLHPLRWMKGPKVTPYSRLPRRLKYIGKESNKLEDVESGLVHSEQAAYTEYSDLRRDEWQTVILPALLKVSLKVLVNESGISSRELKYIRAGRSRPHPRNREILISILRRFHPKLLA